MLELVDKSLSELDSQFNKETGPIPLIRALPPPELFPTDALGTILAPLVNKMVEVIQAPTAICGQSLLAAAALTVQGHADVIIDGRVIPISEFFLTIGASGERKSAVDSVALSPHRIIQDSFIQNFDSQIANWSNQNEAFESSKKSYLRKAKTHAEKMRISESIGYPPKKPLDPLIFTDEPTYEGLIKLLMSGQPSIGLFSDEGGRFIGGHGMNNDNLLKTAAGLSNLWDGKQTTRVRAGDPVAVLAGKRVSFHLMVQPNVAQMVLSNPLLIGQGLVSRCLLTWPNSTAGSRFYKEIDLHNSSEYKNYAGRIDEIYKTPLVFAEGKQNELLPRKIQLSKEAKALFIEFHDSVEREICESGTLSAIRSFACKAAEHALRLAAILALFYEIKCTEISAEAMKSGVLLVNYYLQEAIRLHNSSVINPDLVLAEKLLAWLHSRVQAEISLVDTYQLGPSPIRDAQTARKLMKILVDHNWVSPITGGMSIDGVPRKEVWRVKNTKAY